MVDLNEEILVELKEIHSLLEIIAEGISTPQSTQQPVESNHSVEEIISSYKSRRKNKH